MELSIPDSTEGKSLRNETDFSFVQGGLFVQLMRWAHVSDGVLMNMRLRVIVMALLAWLPLLVFSGLEGRMLVGTVAVPFLLDVEAHIRFLVALPLLIIAELEVHRRLPLLLQQFLVRRLVPQNSMTRFEAAVASASRLRISVLAEALLIAFVYGVGILIVWRHYWALDAVTWYATPSAQGSKLTLAGMWYGYVSVPIVQFLLLRWYWRLFVWARLLWQVSRIELSLVPAHPDRAGGLGFLATTGLAFSMIGAAHGTLLAGQLASRIFFAGAALRGFMDLIFVAVLFVLCVVLVPLLFFSPQLAAARRAGMSKHEVLAERYVREFDAKWLSGSMPADEALIGSADIQSLADLGSSYEVVRTMHTTPITKQAIVQLVVATLLPIAPLLLTVFPLNELLKQLIKLVF
jgi:hypothetical protein